MMHGRSEIPTVPRQQAALETQQVAPASRATSPGFFKTVFLVRQFHTTPAKISRILYYISLVWGALWAAAGIAATVSASNAGTIIAGIFLILAGSVTFPLLSFMMANRLDRRAAGRTGSHRSQLPISSTLRPVLLIDAEVLPGKISVKGGACAIAERRAARP